MLKKKKTKTHRIVNLITEGIAPENILAVTFTNKSANEMKERVALALEKNDIINESFHNFDYLNIANSKKLPFVSTFHSLGVYLIKENASLLGLTKHFSILDENDALALIKECMKELSFDTKEFE